MKVPALPSESEMLSVEGYHLHIVGPTYEGWEVHLYKQTSDGQFEQMRIGRISKPNISSWGYTRPDQFRHLFNWNQPGPMGPNTIRVMGEVMFHVAKLIEAADEGIKDQIEAAEKARLEREERAAQQRAEYEERRRVELERRAKEAEERRKRVAEIYELVRWLEGQKFRLTRDGYRATVFGTIDRVSEQRMYTTSEKGVPMRIEFRDLRKLEIKYEDEKRYTLIYEKKEETANAGA